MPGKGIRKDGTVLIGPACDREDDIDTRKTRPQRDDELKYMQTRFGDKGNWPGMVTFGSEDAYRQSYDEVMRIPETADNIHVQVDGDMNIGERLSEKMYRELIDDFYSGGKRLERENKMSRVFAVYIVSVDEGEVIYQDDFVAKSAEQAKMKALSGAIEGQVAEASELTEYDFICNEIGTVREKDG